MCLYYTGKHVEEGEQRGSREHRVGRNICWSPLIFSALAKTGWIIGQLDSCLRTGRAMSSVDSESDIGVVLTPNLKRPRPGPSPKALGAFDFGQLGPPTLVLLIADVEGPWSAELKGRSTASKILAKRLAELPRQGQPVLDETTRATIVGLAVLRGWRFVQGQASTSDAHMLIQASLQHNARCKGQRFLEHEVLASAVLSFQGGCAIHPPEGWNAWPATYAGRTLLPSLTQRMASVSSKSASGMTDHLSQGNLKVERILAQWSAEFGLEVGSCSAWPVAPSLALAVARGQWDTDVSVKLRRDSAGTRGPLRLGPAPAIMRRFQEEGSDEVLAPPEKPVSVAS